MEEVWGKQAFAPPPSHSLDIHKLLPRLQALCALEPKELHARWDYIQYVFSISAA